MFSSKAEDEVKRDRTWNIGGVVMMSIAIGSPRYKPTPSAVTIIGFNSLTHSSSSCVVMMIPSVMMSSWSLVSFYACGQEEAQTC